MLLFKLLILAHVVADFPLQSARVWRWKVRSIGGMLPHTLICFGASAFSGFPLLGLPGYWILAAAVSFAHFVIDIFKIRVLDRLAGPGNLWTFLLDQAFHIASLAAVFFTCLPSAAALRGSAWARLDREGVIGVLIFLLASSFGGVYLLRAVKKTIFGVSGEEDGVDGFSKYYGVCERAIVFTLIVLGGLPLLLLPVVVAARIPIANRLAKKFQPKKFLLSPLDAAGSFLIALASALAARLGLPS